MYLKKNLTVKLLSRRIKNIIYLMIIYENIFEINISDNFENLIWYARIQNKVCL